MLLLLLVAAAVVGGFELFPSRLKLYNNETHTSKVKLHPFSVHDQVKQTVDTATQTISIQRLSSANWTSSQVFVWVSRTQQVLVAELFPMPELFPGLYKVHPIELSVHLPGKQLAPKHLGELEFNPPNFEYEYTATESGITIYFSRRPETSPLRLVAISGPAGRVPAIWGEIEIHDLDMLPAALAQVSPNQQQEIYQTGTVPLLLVGSGFLPDTVIGFENSNAVQFEHFTLQLESSTRLWVYPKPTNFVEWAEPGVLRVGLVNGRPVASIPVAIVRSAPLVRRDLQQRVYATELVRITGQGFIADTKLKVSINGKAYEQCIDFSLFVTSSTEMELHWLGTGLASEEGGVLMVDWIALGNAPRLVVQMPIANLLPMEQHLPIVVVANSSRRLYQKQAKSIEIQLAAGNSDTSGSMDVTLLSRSFTSKSYNTKQYLFPKSPKKNHAIVVTLIQHDGWQLGALYFIKSLSKTSPIPIINSHSVPLGVVQLDPKLSPTALRICITHTTRFTLHAVGITLQSRFVFSPSEFQVEREFVLGENGAVTFTCKLIRNELLGKEITLVSVDAGAGVIDLHLPVGRIVDDGDAQCLRDNVNAPIQPLCTDTCGSWLVRDGVCDDGRLGASSSLCPPCTDCTDCSPCTLHK
ncbi:hypothetical protein BASA81_001731 [Batrachochytrium salamandrivorans]|nr:hypothetical protein BASA81_001731 [Batrachochytrium salamandrivorans]